MIHVSLFLSDVSFTKVLPTILSLFWTGIVNSTQAHFFFIDGVGGVGGCIIVYRYQVQNIRVLSLWWFCCCRQVNREERRWRMSLCVEIKCVLIATMLLKYYNVHYVHFTTTIIAVDGWCCKRWSLLPHKPHILKQYPRVIRFRYHILMFGNSVEFVLVSKYKSFRYQGIKAPTIKVFEY